MAKEIHCKDCQRPFGSVYHLTQHKIEAHGYKKKRKKKAVDAPVELTASQTEAQLMENVIGWFEEAALPAAVNARVIAYLASRFAQGVVEYQQLAS